MITRAGSGRGHSWQLVLADLALILFLVTLTALVNSSSDDEPLTRTPHVAPAQALFRPTARGPTLPEWLAEQPADPRLTLTIIAKHSGGDQELMWQDAQMMAASVAKAEIGIRVVITKAQQSDLYASLAYDEPNLEE